jgi:L-asparaginase
MGHIVLLDAGGTISSRPDAEGALAGSWADDRLASVIPRGGAAVKSRRVHSGLSEEMSLAEMTAIVGAVLEAQADPAVDGVVVAHGTDIMEEVAFLADLVVESGKPVVFTGAQKAAGRGRFDGSRNLRDAVSAAASPVMAGAGVAIAFAGRLIPARQAVKSHTSDPRAFRARDGREGKVMGRTVVPPPVVARAQRLPLATPCGSVELVALGAGTSGALIGAAAGLGLRGLVLCALGRGNAGAEVVAAVKAAVEAGLVVVVASRCPEGRTAPDYATGLALQRAGAIFAGDLGSSQARILLATLLTVHGSAEAAGAAFRLWTAPGGAHPPGM